MGWERMTLLPELAHGLTQFTANLIYQNQSGQLNEAMSTSLVR